MKDQGSVANIDSENSDDNKECIHDLQKKNLQIKKIKNGLHKFQLNLSPKKIQFNNDNKVNKS